MASPYTSSSHLLQAPQEIPETTRPPTPRLGPLPKDLPILFPQLTRLAPPASPKQPPGPKVMPQSPGRSKRARVRCLKRRLRTPPPTHYAYASCMQWTWAEGTSVPESSSQSDGR
eukprot:3111166-Rhodomonas_salina.1